MAKDILYLRIEETKQIYEIYPTKEGGIKVTPVKETQFQNRLTIPEKDFNKYCAIARLTDFETGFKHYIRAYENTGAWAMEDLLKGFGNRKHKSVITTSAPWPPKIFTDEADDHVDAVSYAFRDVTLKSPEFATSISTLPITKDPL